MLSEDDEPPPPEELAPLFALVFEVPPVDPVLPDWPPLFETADVVVPVVCVLPLPPWLGEPGFPKEALIEDIAPSIAAFVLLD